MSYDAALVRSIYQGFMRAHLNLHRFDALAAAQRSAREDLGGPFWLRGEYATLTGWSRQLTRNGLRGWECWCDRVRPKVVVTYDDWGDGLRCVQCGALKDGGG